MNSLTDKEGAVVQVGKLTAWSILVASAILAGQAWVFSTIVSSEINKLRAEIAARDAEEVKVQADKDTTATLTVQRQMDEIRIRLERLEVAKKEVR